ncbi:MAG: exonuclease domain-containing protein [Bacteroidia bacterium]
MFAIVDIETCGGQYEYHRGRIIEICILLHDGLQVVDKFSTLINPECEIGTFFTRLSGITNEMVANAPRFHEVAKNILDFTEDRIFVGHNVAFDYSFVKAEFLALGYKYKRETLCTVRLSRKLLPGKISYSLGRLCSSLGIENNARHRAEGDAVATAQLLDLLLQLKSMHPQYKNLGAAELMARKVDKIKQYVLDKLPEECGVYYFMDKDGHIIYIGKSKNMYSRAQSHFNTREKKGLKMLYDMQDVDFERCGSELIALLREAEEIKRHKPVYNRMRKASTFTHCIDWFKNEQGIICFKILPTGESENALLSFVTYATARERLDSWIEDHALCLRYCGLTPEDSVCFNNQIQKCRGICNGDEAPESYNKRAALILEQYIFPDTDFIIIDRGRHRDEQSIILVEEGHYAGYAYADRSEAFQDADELKSIVKRAIYYPDTDDLVRGWMKGKQSYKYLTLKSLAKRKDIV